MSVPAEQIMENAAIYATFYRALIREGVPPDHAVTITGFYLSSLLSETVKMRKPPEPWERS